MRESLEETVSRPSPRHEIPRDQKRGWHARVCAVDPDGAIAVRFRHLAVRIRSLLDTRPHASLLVTSALPGEGKTTVSVNLAIALASIAPEYRVALVDMDLRRGRVGAALEYRGELGIERALAGEVRLDEVRVRTDMPALDFFPVSRPVTDAHRLLGGAAGRILQQLHADYDYVICDGPPVLPVPDIPLILPHIGGCLAVVAAGRTRHARFREMMELVPRTHMLGVFLNESRTALGGEHYHYYDAEYDDGDEGAFADEERAR